MAQNRSPKKSRIVTGRLSKKNFEKGDAAGGGCGHQPSSLGTAFAITAQVNQGYDRRVKFGPGKIRASVSPW